MIALLPILRRFWWIPVIALALAWAWRIDTLRAHYKRDLAALATKYVAAQERALERVKAHKAADEQRYRDHANETDVKAAAEYVRGHDAAAEYIRTHRVRACPTQGASGRTPAAASGRHPESVERSSDPSLVAVSESDIGICTTNSQRLAAAREWALGLNLASR